MSFLGLASPRRDLSRLDMALLDQSIAQQSVHRASEEVASVAESLRGDAVRSRWQARSHARRIRDRSLHTGDARDLVEGMMRGVMAEATRTGDSRRS